jgi:hypothetical protein
MKRKSTMPALNAAKWGAIVLAAMFGLTVAALAQAQPKTTAPAAPTAATKKTVHKDLVIRGTVATSEVYFDSGGFPHPMMTIEGHPEKFIFTPQEKEKFGIPLSTIGWTVEIVFRRVGTEKYTIKSFKRLELAPAPTPADGKH